MVTAKNIGASAAADKTIALFFKENPSFVTVASSGGTCY
jgi:hypothetical protein